MIIDELKRFKEDMKCKTFKGRNASKDSFDTSWYFGNILRYKYWIEIILNHFEAKKEIYIWYEDIEIQFSRLSCQKVEIQKYICMIET